MDDVTAPAGATIELTLNGRQRSVAAGASILDLIAELGLQERLVVVERNGVIIARGDFGSMLLAAGDSLEIVHFVGGG